MVRSCIFYSSCSELWMRMMLDAFRTPIRSSTSTLSVCLALCFSFCFFHFSCSKLWFCVLCTKLCSIVSHFVCHALFLNFLAQFRGPEWAQHKWVILYMIFYIPFWVLPSFFHSLFLFLFPFPTFQDLNSLNVLKFLKYQI